MTTMQRAFPWILMFAAVAVFVAGIAWKGVQHEKAMAEQAGVEQFEAAILWVTDPEAERYVREAYGWKVRTR